MDKEVKMGEWAVFDFNSMDSIPFSDISHSPYGNVSYFLDGQPGSGRLVPLTNGQSVSWSDPQRPLPIETGRRSTQIDESDGRSSASPLLVDGAATQEEDAPSAANSRKHSRRRGPRSPRLQSVINLVERELHKEEEAPAVVDSTSERCSPSTSGNSPAPSRVPPELETAQPPPSTSPEVCRTLPRIGQGRIVPMKKTQQFNARPPTSSASRAALLSRAGSRAQSRCASRAPSRGRQLEPMPPTKAPLVLPAPRASTARPLLVAPIPTVVDSPTASLTDAPPGAATPSAGEQRLLEFVASCGDVAVLSVIRDYLQEHEDGVRTAWLVERCERLLEQQEALERQWYAPQAPPSQTLPRPAPPVRRTTAVLPPDGVEDEDEEEGEEATANGNGAAEAAHALHADENGDDEEDLSDDDDDEPQKDEFDDYNIRPGPFPAAPSGYEFGEPTVHGRVTRVFPDGRLFRIVDATGGFHFFNDTLQDVMMVRVQVRLGGRAATDVRVNPRANQTAVEGAEDLTEITIAVLPEETNFLLSGLPFLPPVKAQAVRTPDDFISPSVTKSMTAVHAGINRVRTALGKWSKATDQPAYLKCCLKNQLKFTDLTFRPSAVSLYRRDAGGDVVPVPALTWRRPEDYLPLTEVAEGRLFRGEISCHLTQQGTLPDHTVVAAIAAVAQRPAHVQWLFRHPLSAEVGSRERAVGAYRVWVCQRGWWESLLIDDYLPASMRGPLFARCPVDPRRLWVPLLEKAYAKSRGSYSALCLIDVVEALADLTGAPTRHLSAVWLAAQEAPAGPQAAQLFKYVQRALKAGYLIVVWTPPATDAQAKETMSLARRRSSRFLLRGRAKPGESGADAATAAASALPFLPGTIYFITDAAHYTDLDLRMVRLTNPWTRRRTSAVVEQDKYAAWREQPEMRSATLEAAPGEAGAAQNGDGRKRSSNAAPLREDRRGTMWLEWGETLSAFNGGGVCYHADYLRQYRVRGHFSAAMRGAPALVLEVSVTRRVEVILTLSPGEADERIGTAIAVTRHRPRDGTEEVAATSCEDLECLAARLTYVSGGQEVAMKMTFDPQESPHYVLPRMLHPEEQEQGGGLEADLPFVVGLFTTEAVGYGSIEVRCRELPAGSPAFDRDVKSFTLQGVQTVRAPYQFVTSRGVESGEGGAIVGEPPADAGDDDTPAL